MKNSIEFLDAIIKERPLGSEENKNITNIIEEEALKMEYDIISLPFDCKLWEKDKSFVKIGELSYEIFPSPFSKEYKGTGEMLVINSLEELKSRNLAEKILILQGEIAKEPLQPKGFPFYYPNEHKQIIDLLEKSKPKAIIANTGKHPMCGLNPFYVFEDANFSIPSAYTNKLTEDKTSIENEITVCINSKVLDEKGRQLVIMKKVKNDSNGKIIVCAHMDSKYGTLGALDNASGVAIMLEMMKSLRDYNGIYDIHFIPFNGEEYFEVKGELEYLNYMKEDLDSIKLVINIDSPCHKNSQTAISTYNFTNELSKKLNNEITKSKNIVRGKEWYSGDHTMFAFKKIPCIAVTSSDLFESALDITHTEMDTIDQIDFNLIKDTSDFLSEFINSIII